jgi:hypothetical protein
VPLAQLLPCAVADSGSVGGGGSISTPSSTRDRSLISTRPSALQEKSNVHYCIETITS